MIVEALIDWVEGLVGEEGGWGGWSGFWDMAGGFGGELVYYAKFR